ncbi:ATP-binding protein [Microbulbifer sp. OS29]|uniref:ATP-binding protein n=1 Tax=Microbulbifer okhotskensis TaxID=2926617 RepID=A0A9X2EMN1_9GAMM|nr:ATP-binding protein [Microbulbifer okhotskensis]MCO1334541.1 ATP-binding protein [Microbulbifer okhotskensis]
MPGDATPSWIDLSCLFWGRIKLVAAIWLFYGLHRTYSFKDVAIIALNSSYRYSYCVEIVASIYVIYSGSTPRPGEISLAHRGVLFLDEMPEFPRNALEILREPLENGEVRISRARAQVTYPAHFQLVGAMNPCPCGYQGEPRCRCTPDQIDRYRSKLSGPLLDRIDMQVEVGSMNAVQLQDSAPGEPSECVRKRVCAARQLQIQRQGTTNSLLKGAELETHCALGEEEKHLLRQSVEKLGLSARSYHRVLKVARTLADLASLQRISSAQIAEALAYRNLDRRQAVIS